MRSVPRLAAALLALCALHAVAQETRWGFAQLMTELAQVQSSRARYTEVRRAAVLDKPLLLSGTLSYRRPDRIEKRQTAPFGETIRVEGARVTLERGGKSQSLMLQDSTLVGALVESLRATLAGDAASLETLYSVKLEGGPGRWTLLLEPRDPGVAGVVEKISIAGSGARLSRIEILEPGGDSSTMNIGESSP
jgi:Outer membrane lipoprotein carrier protein LolA-like